VIKILNTRSKADRQVVELRGDPGEASFGGKDIKFKSLIYFVEKG